MAVAVICEFNPFHNGHAYLLREARRLTNTPVVCVMSGSFTQRGEAAITDKFTRAAIALKNGADPEEAHKLNLVNGGVVVGNYPGIIAQEQVPFRSRMGNTITRGVMKLACGVAVTDTQTGLRAIARRHLELMCRIEGERYEYETEMLMALRQAGVGIGEVVIDTVYINENESSHFNAFKDSWKIYKIIFRRMFRRGKL